MSSETIENLAFLFTFLLGIITALREIFPKLFSKKVILKPKKGRKAEETEMRASKIYKSILFVLAMLALLFGYWNNSRKQSDQKQQGYDLAQVQGQNRDLQNSVDNLTTRIIGLKDSLNNCVTNVTNNLVKAGNLTGIELHNIGTNYMRDNQVTIVPFGDPTQPPVPKKSN